MNYYRSRNGLPQHQNEILYYPTLNNAVSIPQFLQRVNNNTLRMNRFTVPDLAGEAPDYEGMNWSCEEDRRLLTVNYFLKQFFAKLKKKIFSVF